VVEEQTDYFYVDHVFKFRQANSYLIMCLYNWFHYNFNSSFIGDFKVLLMFNWLWRWNQVS